jgi:FkbM family methyltransferase
LDTRIAISRARIYMRGFGVVKGLIAFFKLSITRKGIVRISIPQSKTWLFLRARTSDWQAFEQVFLSNTYEIGAHMNPKLIVDGGANVGFTSVFFANKYPAAQIVAIEPEETNFEVLKENTCSYVNINRIQSGVWNKKTLLQIENPQDEKWGFRVRETETRDGAFEALTIDDILASSNAQFIDILKLDIEGAEREVFSDCQNWLGKVGVLVVELHDRSKAGCSQTFYSAISSFDFEETQSGDNVILVKRTLMERAA